MERPAGSLSLVLPVYNEERRVESAIGPLVDFVASYGRGSELIFVDDGSTDATVALIEKAIAAGAGNARCAVRVLRRAHDGKGAATQAGILDAHGDLVAFCDVDLATPLDELARIIDVAADGVLAIGSRGLPTSRLGARQKKARELLGNAFNRAAQLLVTPGIADTQCGAKAAPRELWHDVLPAVQEAGFAWDVDVIAQARVRGYAVAEVPIAWNHQPDSGIRLGRDGARMLAALPGIRRRARAQRATAKTAIAAVQSATAAPEGAFDDWNAETLAASDAEHWWFRSKAAYVNWALGRFATRSGSEWLADLGAGGAGVTARLAWDRRRVIAVEGSDLLARCGHAVHRINVARGDAAAPPLRSGSADVVCLLDVIEHSPEPVAILRAARQALAPGGVCVVTVPGHQRLWSEADVVLGHHRRYNRRTLRADLEAAGLDVEYVGHMFSWLVPPVWLRRKVTRSGSAELGLETDSSVISAAALVLTATERAVLRRVSLPLGTSVIAVARANGIA